jgi:nicotinate-nucleotide pyrophosphorylase (carboxylating)
MRGADILCSEERSRVGVVQRKRLSDSWDDAIREIVDRALQEDLGQGDVTTSALIAPAERCRARVVAKGDGVLAGIDVAGGVFEVVDPGIAFEKLTSDGSRIWKGETVAVVEGAAAAILKAERTALNFLQHLSGIATETARYVLQTKGTKAVILDTRKTLPGLRMLEKYAVRMGGGGNHRMHLGESVLIKDNHLAVLRSAGVGVREAVKMARGGVGNGARVEVEVESVEAASEALEAGADMIMLDNMAVGDMRRVVEIVAGRALLEASGGITVANAADVARSGVDFISIGTLTHSAPALDLSLEIEP